MPLIRVRLAGAVVPDQRGDLPGYASKSTSCRTCTAPKLLLTARSDRIGCVVADGRRCRGRARHRHAEPLPRGESGVAGGWSHLAAGGPAASGPGPRRGQDDAGRLCRPRRTPPVQTSEAFRKPSSMTSLTLSLKIETGVSSADGTSLFRTVSLTVPVAMLGGVLALDQRDGERGGRVGLLLDGLVDGHALVAGEDRLQARDAGVLARDRHLAVEVVGLEPGDDAAGHRVVGGDDAVDLAAVLGVELLEGGAGHGGVPLAGLVADELVVAGVDLRLQRLGVALLEQRRVVVGRVAVDEDDVGRGLARVGQALLQALAHQLADLDVVERHVVASRRRPASAGRSRWS